MTRVVFENATLRDVVGKAAKIAPTKGTAFDKAAGIFVEIDPDHNEVVVRANNTEVFYVEIADPVEIQADRMTRWLLPSSLFDGICSKLPIASGRQVTLEDNGSEINITSARMRAKLRMMNADYYHLWDPFDEEQLTAVENFAGRIQQVQWAASKDATQVPKNGVHLNGEYAMATDNYRACITPCKIEHLEAPITIPAQVFAPLMKNLGEVRIGQDGGRLLLMPDDSTQISTVIFPGKFPPVLNVFKRNETHSIVFKKEALTELIDRAMVMGVRDRAPLLKLYLGEGELAVFMADEELGGLMDVMDLSGQANHPRYIIGVTPENMQAALNAAPNADVALYYWLDQPKKPLRLDGGSGWEGLIVPRNLEKASS